MAEIGIEPVADTGAPSRKCRSDALAHREASEDETAPEGRRTISSHRDSPRLIGLSPFRSP